MADNEYRPGRTAVMVAVLTIAATYIHFLLFAQFGFLKMVQGQTGNDARTVRLVLLVMGLAGVVGSAGAAGLFTGLRARRLLKAGFLTGGVAAGLTMASRDTRMLYAVATLTGLGTGVVTVTLASLLRSAVGGRRLGMIIGLGTGLAYGFCNLPAVFVADANHQAGWAVLAAVAGLVGARLMTVGAPVRRPSGGDYSRAGIAAWVLIFLVLVILDSAAFYVIQHTPELKAATWTGAARLGANAGMHVVAAVLAGLALDRKWPGWTIGLGALLLLSAGGLMDESHRHFATGTLLYTAGVSVYSTALVFYPAYSARPWLVALVYTVAGWGGSALGIGLVADHQGKVSMIFITIAAGVVAAALGARYLIGKRTRAV